MKGLLKIGLLSIFILTGLLILNRQSTLAAAQYCYFLVPATTNTGNNNDCLTYGQVGAPNPQALTNLWGLSGSQLKSQFIADIENDASKTVEPQHFGGNYIMNVLTNSNNPTNSLFSKDIQGDSLTVKAFAISSLPANEQTNSAYDPNGTNPYTSLSGDGGAVQYSDTGTYDAVIISHTYPNGSVSQLIIKLSCGNILGNLHPPFPQSLASLTTQSLVSKNYPGTQSAGGYGTNVTMRHKAGDLNLSNPPLVYFSHTVTNNDSTYASDSFTWDVSGSHNGAGWSSTANGQNAYSGSDACGQDNGQLPYGPSSALNPGQSNPNGGSPNGPGPNGYQQIQSNGFCIYEFPSGSSANDTYCQYVTAVDNNDGNTYKSTKVCATYSPLSCTTCSSCGTCCTTCTACGTCTTPTINISVSCTGVSFQMPSSYYKTDTSGRFAIYESPVQSSLPTWSNTGGDGSGGYPSSAGVGGGSLPNQVDASYQESVDPNTNTPTYYSSANDYGWISSTDVSGIGSPPQYMEENAPVSYTLSSSQLSTGTVTWYVVVYNDTSSTGNTVVDQSQTKSASNCFTPVYCSINVDEALSSSSSNEYNMESQTPFNFSVDVNNNGNYPLDEQLNLPDGNPNLVMDYLYNTPGSSYQQQNIAGVGAGSSNTVGTGYLTAPNDTSSYTLTVYIGYAGTSLGNFPPAGSPSYLGTCQVTIDDYAQFQYNPAASVTLLKQESPNITSTEDPHDVEKTYYNPGPTAGSNPYTGTPDNLNGQTPAGVRETGQLYYVPAGTSPSSTSNPRGGPDSLVGQTFNYTTYYGPITDSLNAGDAYCLQENIFPGSGYIGPGGAYLDSDGTPDSSYTNAPTASLNPPTCATINNEPYATFTGNDVIGDPAFDPVCQNANASGNGFNSGIFTMSTDNATSGGYSYPSSTSSPAGSGGTAEQFGAQAVGIIEGLTSASFRSSGANPTGPAGLTFANAGNDDPGGIISSSSSATPPAGIPSDGNPVGGYFGYSSSLCEPDYFTKSQPPQADFTDYINNGSIPNNPGVTNQIMQDLTKHYDKPFTPTASNPYGYNYYIGNSFTLGDKSSDITINNGVRDAIFVNGNVYIDDNVIYTGSGSWTNLSDIPSFYLIAKGNIYIDPSVTKLDGVFIAESDPTSSTPSGVIDTCANTSGPFNQNYLYGDGNFTYSTGFGTTGTGTLPGCNQQLTINGAFVDEATLLDRTFSTLRHSEAGENSNLGTSYTSHNCGSITSGGVPGDINSSYGSSSFTDCGAEIFNFSPEIYLSQPAFLPSGGPTSGTYHYIAGLSPVL